LERALPEEVIKKKRVLLLNDTSDQNHPGCRLVVKNTLRLCEENHMQVVGTVLHGDELPIESIYRKYIDEVDIVLLNGEGTMHHDRAKAKELMELALLFENKAKLVLFNTIWQENHELNRYLKYFKLIFARESLSTLEIRGAGFRCMTVPDMLFATDVDHLIEESNQTLETVLVTDSVREKISLSLAGWAYSNNWDFMALHPKTLKMLRRKTPLKYLLLKVRGKIIKMKNDEEFITSISKHGLIISGRFHAICMSILLNKPVVAISSNTHKIEGLFHDANIPSSLIHSSTNPEPVDQKLLHLALDSAQCFKNYTFEARKSISDMFKQIALI
jgi:exopolysaccharide biosynthesis predicted pyruvyltransferase EpsI